MIEDDGGGYLKSDQLKCILVRYEFAEEKRECKLHCNDEEPQWKYQYYSRDQSYSHSNTCRSSILQAKFRKLCSIKSA